MVVETSFLYQYLYIYSMFRKLIKRTVDNRLGLAPMQLIIQISVVLDP